MSNLVPRRTADGRHEVVRTTDERAVDQALFRPIIGQLQVAIDILGGEQAPLEAVHEAADQVADAIRKLRQAEPGVVGDERDDALRVLRPLTRQLREVERTYLSNGR